MRALSIRQPWASYIFADKPGWKNIENRNWAPLYRTVTVPGGSRNNLYIHAASSKATADDIKKAREMAFKAGLFLHPKPEDYKYGGYLGIVKFVQVVKHHSSPWFAGPLGWVFTDPYPMPFIPGKGQQGLFLFDSIPLPSIAKTDIERWHVNVPVESVKNDAIRRGILHTGHRTERFYNDHSQEDTTGLQVERAFSILSKLPMDERMLIRGDGGRDFVGLFHGTPHSINTKGVQGYPEKQELTLPVKEEDVIDGKTSDLYVLGVAEGDWVQFYGWCTIKEALKCPIYCFFPRKIPNYMVRVSQLHPMEDLLDYLEPLS